MVKFLLTCNEFKVERIINSSSQFHWDGGKGWNAFHPVGWISEQIDLYAAVYDNLVLHDSNYPTPDYLRSRWKVGNTRSDGEDDLRSHGCRIAPAYATPASCDSDQKNLTQLGYSKTGPAHSDSLASSLAPKEFWIR